ncbi:hypothetical protein ACJX0J_040122, partial [Zea mays]
GKKDGVFFTDRLLSCLSRGRKTICSVPILCEYVLMQRGNFVWIFVFACVPPVFGLQGLAVSG